MKHATQAALAELDGLLQGLRLLPGLKERKPGVFYHKSRAFLHFHEEGSKRYADLRLSGTEFERFSVTTPAEQRRLLTKLQKHLQ